MMARAFHLSDAAKTALLRANLDDGGVWTFLRADQRHDGVWPPPDQGRHARMTSREHPAGTTVWYLRLRDGSDYDGRHRRDPEPVYPLGRNRCIAVINNKVTPRAYFWWRAGNTYPGVTSSMGDRDNSRQRLVQLPAGWKS